MSFADRLDRAVRERRSPIVLGLDPHPDLLPEPYALARDPTAPREARAEAVERFLGQLIDLAAERVAAVKPQSAFFEALGPAGIACWERVIARAHAAGLLAIGDVKRGDVPSTARAYARAYLEGIETTPPEVLPDAITVQPLLGADSLEPFVAAAREHGRGLFVLVRTSNPGSADLQLLGEPPLSVRVAALVDRLGADLVGDCGLSSVGAVVGATHPEVLAELRAAMPRAPLLLPGVGAQGAGAADVVQAFLPGGRGALVSASRSVAFAYRTRPGLSWEEAASRALDELLAQLRAALAER